MKSNSAQGVERKGPGTAQMTMPCLVNDAPDVYQAHGDTVAGFQRAYKLNRRDALDVLFAGFAAALGCEPPSKPGRPAKVVQMRRAA